MTEPNPDPARTAFLILQFMRLSGAGFIVLGALFASGRISAPAPLGYGFVVLGAVEALILPRLLVRKWTSRD